VQLQSVSVAVEISASDAVLSATAEVISISPADVAAATVVSTAPPQSVKPNSHCVVPSWYGKHSPDGCRQGPAPAVQLQPVSATVEASATNAVVSVTAVVVSVSPAVVAAATVVPAAPPQSEDLSVNPGSHWVVPSWYGRHSPDGCRQGPAPAVQLQSVSATVEVTSNDAVVSEATVVSAAPPQSIKPDSHWVVPSWYGRHSPDGCRQGPAPAVQLQSVSATVEVTSNDAVVSVAAVVSAAPPQSVKPDSH